MWKKKNKIEEIRLRPLKDGEFIVEVVNFTEAKLESDVQCLGSVFVAHTLDAVFKFVAKELVKGSK